MAVRAIAVPDVVTAENGGDQQIQKRWLRHQFQARAMYFGGPCHLAHTSCENWASFNTAQQGRLNQPFQSAIKAGDFETVQILSPRLTGVIMDAKLKSAGALVEGSCVNLKFA